MLTGTKLPYCGWSFRCLDSISNNAGEAVFVKYVVCICVVCLEVVCPYLRMSWAVSNEMSYCLCLVVTSGAYSCICDIHVVQVFVKSYLSNKLKGSSVVYSVVDKLFVEFVMCVCFLE